MESNTSCRLSSNEYDTANEDSISMYYSFNGSLGEKTLENSGFDSTVDLTIEDHPTGTVVKAPPQVASPIKGKCSRSLKLDSTRLSTPLDMRKKLLAKSVNINSKSLLFSTVAEKIDQKQENVATTDAKNESLDCMIVESLSEMKIDTNTHIDSSIGNGKVCEKANKSVESLEVLKDASMKMWPENNHVEVVDVSNDLLKLYGDKVAPEIIISEVIDKDKSLAEKVVKDIHTLLQGREKQMASVKGKENIQQEIEEANNSDMVKMEVSKKATGQLKPSRLSTFKTRQSILQGDIQSSTKTVTPITRISANSRKSIASASTGIPSLREFSSSSSSLQSITDKKETNVPKSSMLPKKRMSILPSATSSLNSIPENKQQSDGIKKTKRLSFMNAKPTPRFRPIAKTTLSSPVMARKDYMRRSVSKFSTASALPVNKGTSATFKQPSIPEVRPETSQNKSNATADKIKSIPSKTHIPREDFVCEICSRSFRVSSIFEAHKKSHNPTATKETNTCKFCDKSFAIMKALDKHLLENCLKIPLAERKKFKIAASQASEEARADSLGIGRSRVRSQRASILPTSEKSNSRKSVMNSLMPPPSTTKIVRMPVAHSGIVKTPNKTVSCKPCEKSFDNVLAFAEHVLSHSNSSLGEE